MEACTNTCALDNTGILSVVTWQKKKNTSPQILRVQVFEAHTYSQQTHKPTKEVSKLQLSMEAKPMQLTSHLRDGEKLCL